MRRFLHSRYALLLTAVMAVGGGVLYYSLGKAPWLQSNGALVGPWSAPWPLDPVASLCIGLALNIGVAAMLASINKTFNLLRCMTMLPGVAFLCMQMAAPAMLAQLQPGVALAAVVLACCFIMFGSYANPDSQRSVFLTFFLLSACSAFDDSYLLYMPVFMLACGQMRIFSLRTALACLLGLATPWIIIFGLGLASPAELVLPEFFAAPVGAGIGAVSGRVGLVVFTAFVAVCCWMQSVMKFLSYNAQSRGMLSVVMVVMMVTILGIVVDFGNVYSFLPLLNCCAALQMGHLFGVVFNQPKSYWAIISVLLIDLAVFAWKIVDCIL